MDGHENSPPPPEGSGVSDQPEDEDVQNGHPPPRVLTINSFDVNREEKSDGDGANKEELPFVLDPEATGLDFSHQKITRLANLETLTAIETLCFRWNFLKKIENVSMLTTLTELDFYDNQLTAIENLESLVNLQNLDLSFNRIKKIENLSSLRSLRKLFLCANKISKLENLDELTQLEQLELGDNRIRVIENLDNLTNLKELHVGKNKIGKLENLDHLAKLELLTVQSNRLTKIEGLDKLENLEQLYISNNGLTKIEGLEHLVKLETLDLAGNKIQTIDNLENLINLQEFWVIPNYKRSIVRILKIKEESHLALQKISKIVILLNFLKFNDNLLEDWSQLDNLKHATKIQTVYLERNPLWKDGKDVNYRRKIKLTLPSLVQIDATLCK